MDVLNYIQAEAEYRTVGEGKKRQDPITGNIPESEEHIKMTEYLNSLDDEAKQQIGNLISVRGEQLKNEGDVITRSSSIFNKESIEYKKLHDVHKSIYSQLYIINNEIKPLIDTKAKTM